MLLQTATLSAETPASKPASRPAASQPAATRPAAPRIEINLLTMGSGDDLYQRAGHAALEVRTIDAAGKAHSVVYNYGDADFDDPALVEKFFRGTLRFRLSLAGTREQVLAVYGRTQDRDVWLQHLALTPLQARKIAARLAREVKPDRRYYPYHHIERICTTRIRDLLDEFTDSALAKQLGNDWRHEHPHTIRYYQPRGFRGHHLAFIAGDVLIGRRHDRRMTNHYALYIPELLRLYLQRVVVPSPTGGSRKVPLASKPEQLYSRWKPPAVTEERGQSTLVFFGGLGLVVLLLAVGGLARPADKPRLGGAALLLWSLVAGLCGLAITLLVLLSGVPELRQNELLLSFWPTDLLLLGVAVRWLRGRAQAGRWLRIYVWLHLLVLAAVVVGHAVGLLYQRPLILVGFAGLGQIALYLLVRRLPLPSRVTTT